MKPLYALVPAFAFALASLASALGVGMPGLEPKYSLDLATAPDEHVIANLEAGVNNYFALQKYYLSLVNLKRAVDPSDAEGKIWATKAVQAESEALGELFPAVEKILTRQPVIRDIAPKTAKISHAIMPLMSAEDQKAWETARLRANFGSSLSALYWTRISKRANDRDYQRALDHTAKARVALYLPKKP